MPPLPTGGDVATMSMHDETDSIKQESDSADCNCFLCNQCPQSFSTLEALEGHMQQAHEHDEIDSMIMEEDDELKSDLRLASTPNSLQSDTSSPTSPTSGTPTRGPKQYKCRFCQKAFDSRSQLNIHYTHTHRDKPQYECDLCDMVFSVKRELSTHRRTHSGESTHICTQCGTRQLLKKHWMWHTGERSHVCPHCQKAFFQKGHLTQHLMIHAGGRPHVCNLCSKTFIFKFDLNRHMKIHQERGESYRFACESCGRAFLKEADLKTHEPQCDGVRIESSASAELDTTGDNSSLLAPSPITKTPNRAGKRKAKASVQQSPSPPKTPVTMVTDDTKESVNSSSIFPSPSTNGQNSNGQFFCFLCMRPFTSQAAYTLHLTYVHFKGAVQQLNGNGKDSTQTNHGTAPAAILNGLQQNGIDLAQVFGQLPISTAAANAMAQMANQSGIFTQANIKEDQHDHSFTSSPTGAADISGSDESATSCSHCSTNQQRARDLEKLVANREAELSRLRENIKRVQQMSQNLLSSCSDFDKVWMLHSKKVFTQIQTILAGLNEQC